MAQDIGTSASIYKHTRLGSHGTWHYLFVTDPGRLGLDMNAHTEVTWDQGVFELT